MAAYYGTDPYYSSGVGSGAVGYDPNTLQQEENMRNCWRIVCYVILGLVILGLIITLINYATRPSAVVYRHNLFNLKHQSEQARLFFR